MTLRDRAKDAASKVGAAAKDKAQEKLAERREAKDSPVVSAPTPSPAGVLFQGTSHDEGRNATVTLYADRLERVQERSRTSLSRAAQDTEVTPVKAISSVQASKDGRRTKVTVFASGNNIVFRFDHGAATLFRGELLKLIV